MARLLKLVEPQCMSNIYKQMVISTKYLCEKIHYTLQTVISTKYLCEKIHYTLQTVISTKYLCEKIHYTLHKDMQISILETHSDRLQLLLMMRHVFKGQHLLLDESGQWAASSLHF